MEWNEIKIDNEQSVVWNALTDIGDASVVNPILRMLSNKMATYNKYGTLIGNSGSDIDFKAKSCLNRMRKRGVEIRPVIDYFLKKKINKETKNIDPSYLEFLFKKICLHVKSRYLLEIFETVNVNSTE